MACKRLLKWLFASSTPEGLMISNDILRSVRYILKANNNDLVRILALDNVEATAEQIAVWLRKED
ncbi:DUF1456 family protein, partial [Shigella flexneri]|nr:DUF1456 family protein [Shigella flexneri]